MNNADGDEKEEGTATAAGATVIVTSSSGVADVKNNDNKSPTTKLLSCTGKANEYHNLDEENNNNNNNNDNDNNDNDDGDDSSSSNEEDSDDDDDDSDSSSDDDNDEDEDKPNDGLSDYERLRIERIRRNQERLQQLGLQQFNIAPIKKVKKKVSIGGGNLANQKENNVAAAAASRSQPKRSAKKKLQHGELLEGGLNVPKMRLSLGLTPSGKGKMKNRNITLVKSNKHMYSKRCKYYVT
jgi:hypothetical protein